MAMAAGLASMDMPIPHVATWEWANWKFPRPVKAGDTIYARWTLTQKRAPVGGAKTSIAVWRVDVHTTDGALCAEATSARACSGRQHPRAPRRQTRARPRPQLPHAGAEGALAALARSSRRKLRLRPSRLSRPSDQPEREGEGAAARAAGRETATACRRRRSLAGLPHNPSSMSLRRAASRWSRRRRVVRTPIRCRG